MFRERARLFTILQFCTDLVLSCLAFPLAYWTRLRLDRVLPAGLAPMLNPELYPIGDYLWLAASAVAWWAASASALGLYRLGWKRCDWAKLRIVLESSVLMGLFLGFLSFALKLVMSRPLIALFALYQAALLCLARGAVGLQGACRTGSPADGRNIVIIGTGPKAREMARLIERYAEWGLRVLGFVEPNGARREDACVQPIGTTADLPEIIERHVIDEMIFVGSSPADLARIGEILDICRERGIRTRVALDVFPARVSKASMEFLEGVPLVTFSTTPDHPLQLLVKRAFDVAASLALLVLLLPLMTAVGILVKLTSKGPIIYRQIRCGLYGRKFVLYKFRSMQEGAEDILWEIKHLNEMDGPVFKMRDDPRVTPLGRLLRKSSIDELPQLWNVLKGEMSLVGPRAPLPEEVREYTPWQRRRLSVKPGITCLWQVAGRNEIDFHEWMKLDLQYIDNWSLLLDLKILLRTVPVVVLCKGAR